MLGAIIGDIVGSRHEFNNYKARDFDFLTDKCFFTDDTVMTAAVADAILKCDGDYSELSRQSIKSMQEIGRQYPFCGYGTMFHSWMFSDEPKPYNSYGNGSAMRVSAVAWAARSLEECIELSEKVTRVSHNHPEGIKGAEATAVAIYMALHGSAKEDIMLYLDEHYYEFNFTIDSLRPGYRHNETCQNSVPQALQAFSESENYEDCIRIAVSLGGDSDTIAAIAGSVAEAFYGIPEHLRNRAMKYLDPALSQIVMDFEKRYGTKIQAYDLSRFLDAQDTDYEQALSEIRAGRKESHWMWYIFPQAKGLGKSCTAQYYGLDGIEEAKAYHANETLRKHLEEISEALIATGKHDAEEVMGYPDCLKLRSCMTLFAEAVPECNIFQGVLDQFYGGEKDTMTLELIRK